MNYKHSKILFVDDEQPILNALRRNLREQDFDCLYVDNISQALDCLANEEIDVVISDLSMPEMTGDKFLNKVKQYYPNVTRAMLSGNQQASSIVQAINEGHIVHFIEKPWATDQLIHSLYLCLQHHYQQRLIKSLAETINSSGMGILVVDGQGDIVVCNDWMSLLLGREKNNITKSNIVQFKANILNDSSLMLADLMQCSVSRMQPFHVHFPDSYLPHTEYCVYIERNQAPYVTYIFEERVI